MQQRQLRLGDILDDYCPRERRLTNHAVVAMVGDDVKQTRCTTCEAEHEYKHAKVPRQRRKSEEPAALYSQVLAGGPKRSTGGELWRGASAGGAQALGAGRAGLRRGAPADFITLDREHPALVGRQGDTLIDSLVFAGRHGAIDTVWRQGRRVVEGGRHHAREAVGARYRQTLRDLLA